jgi:steroid delta-isomerase-like uncharacterized protein
MGHEVADKLVDAIKSRDAGALAVLFADDAVLRHPLNPLPMQGKAAIEASERALFDAFSDIDVEVLRVVAEGDDVVMEIVIRATNTGALDVGANDMLPPTNQRIELPSVWLLSLGTDGRIVEERDYFDTATFVRQLGLASDM